MERQADFKEGNNPERFYNDTDKKTRFEMDSSEWNIQTDSTSQKTNECNRKMDRTAGAHLLHTSR